MSTLILEVAMGRAPLTPKADATMRRVLDAAAALFSSQGFEATSTRAIAAAAGVSQGTVFRYAATKEDLVELLFRERIGRALAAAAATSPSPPAPFADVAMHWCTAFVLAYSHDPALAAVIVKELPFLRGELQGKQQELTAALFMAWHESIEVRQRVGAIRADVAPMVLVGAAFSLYFGALVAWLSGQLDRYGALALLRAQLELLERGVAHDQPGAGSPVSQEVANDDRGDDGDRSVDREL